MLFRYFLTVMLMVGTANSVQGQQQTVPEQVYSDLEYIISLSHNEENFNPGQLTGLINFVHSTPSETSLVLKKRREAEGAFHAFSIQGDLETVLDYAYNPDIPIYVTMPSSLRKQEWLTPQITDSLRNLPRNAESAADIRLLRGREREAITPNTNTGGYYVYNQNRIVSTLPGPTGPVLISVSSQTDLSEVGKKGCVVGDDKDWNYLYSGEKGLNKTGLGWINSYMYYADSVLIFVADSSSNTVHVGSFKWLNAGWAKINMVKSSHILDGIKRFATAFKTVLEAPGLPTVPLLAGKYRELMQASTQSLHQMVLPYLQDLANSGDSALNSNPFKKLLSSGKYLQQMGHEEMVRVILLEYIKEHIGK